MRNRTYDEDFNLDCVKYCAEHLELSQAEAAKNLNVPEKTLNRWLVNSKKETAEKLYVQQQIIEQYINFYNEMRLVMHWNMIFPIITRKI